jgi:hypothetical protein
MSIPPFLGLKRFTHPDAGPPAGGLAVAITPQALSAYTQCRLLEPEKYNGEMHGVNPFFSFCLLLCRLALLDGSDPHCARC